MTKSNPAIILLTESHAQSWKRDASTWCLAFACLVPGWYLEMVSVSILGTLVLVLMIGKAVFGLGSKPLTLDEARAKISEIEAEEKRRKGCK